MSGMTRSEGHLAVAGIRVLEHLNGRSPTPAELADLLDLSESAVRLWLNRLQDLEAVALVDSAYETHVEIKDHHQVEHLDEAAGPAISESLAEFDRKKEEEARRMANLFDSGEHEKKRREKIDAMDEDLRSFRKQKPTNPFGDDD